MHVDDGDRVFVYGTLLEGCRNHHWLMGARKLGDHVTGACYTLYDLGPYPGVMAKGATAVVGEVYLVSAGILARLDVLEDYPREYTRERIDTPFGPAWIYLYRQPPPHARPLVGGDWRQR